MRGNRISDYYRSTPVQVCNLSSVVAVSSSALSSFGTQKRWDRLGVGDNSYGPTGRWNRLGRYYTCEYSVQVQGLSSVTAIAAGEVHSLALKSDGTVWAWGNNYYGQLGDGTTTDRYTPVQVQGLSSVVAVAADISHSLAVKSDGTVWAWGKNDHGQLGDGTTCKTLYPRSTFRVSVQ